MKTKQVETTEYILNANEMRIIRKCLQYFNHRLKNHAVNGSHGAMQNVSSRDYNNLLREINN